MKAITIIPTTDARLITQLNEEIQQLHHEMYPETFKAWEFDAIYTEVSELMAREDVSVYIAELEAEPVGYVVCWPIVKEERAFSYAQKTLYVDQICVLETFRGNKIGTQLMNFVEEFAVENNCDFLEIHHWDANVQAEKLYNRLGYETFMKRRRKSLK